MTKIHFYETFFYCLYVKKDTFFCFNRFLRLIELKFLDIQKYLRLFSQTCILIKIRNIKKFLIMKDFPLFFNTMS